MMLSYLKSVYNWLRNYALLVECVLRYAACAGPFIVTTWKLSPFQEGLGMPTLSLKIMHTIHNSN